MSSVKFLTLSVRGLRNQKIELFLISGKFQHNATKVETPASTAPDHKAVFWRINVNEELEYGSLITLFFGMHAIYS